MNLENLTFEYVISPSRRFGDPQKILAEIDDELLQHLADANNSLSRIINEEGPGRTFNVSVLDKETIISFVAGYILDSRTKVADIFSHFTRPVYKGEPIRGKGIMRKIYREILIPKLKQEGVHFVTTVVNQDEPGTEVYEAAQIADAAFKRLGYINARLNKNSTKIIRPNDPCDYVLDLR